MSRTERKLRQALAEIEALRVDRPKESIELLTTQNFEMRSALREAEVVLAKLQIAEAEGKAPCEWLTPLEFALSQVRSALGMPGAIVWHPIALPLGKPVTP